MPDVHSPAPDAAPDLARVRARAKVLAREDRQLKDNLVRLRRDAGLTQKQVAELLGVTPQAVQKLERYDSDPKLSTLRRYSNAVGALVEHHVTVDVGQSVHLAATSPWDAATRMAVLSVASVSAIDDTKSSPWSNSKRTDFALAG